MKEYESKEFSEMREAIDFAASVNGFYQYCSHENGGVWVVFYKR